MDKYDLTEEKGILGNLLQRLDMLTLSLTEKKKELDSYAHKAQEVADTLDVASTKLISSFTDVANLEQALQNTIAQNIVDAADRVAHQASREIGLQLQEVVERLNDTAQRIQYLSQDSLSSLRYRRWIWMGTAGLFGVVSACVTTGIFLWFSDPARSELNQKLIKYGSAFVHYIEQLPKPQQETLYQKIKLHLQK
jgi:phage-related protein